MRESKLAGLLSVNEDDTDGSVLDCVDSMGRPLASRLTTVGRGARMIQGPCTRTLSENDMVVQMLKGYARDA